MRGVAFHFPYIAGGQFTPGHQPFSPGEPTANWAGHEGLKDVDLPWPGQVPYLRVLTNQIEFNTIRPVAPVPNNYATGLHNIMFLGGVLQKSKG